MKVPMQWIRQYTDIPVTPEEFESAMIMHGTGVEGLENQKRRAERRCGQNSFRPQA